MYSVPYLRQPYDVVHNVACHVHFLPLMSEVFQMRVTSIQKKILLPLSQND